MPGIYDIDMDVPFDEVGIIEKSDTGKRILYGWASTEELDKDNERVLQKGLNLDPIKKAGWVNWDHERHNLIGYPTVAEIKKRDDGKLGFYTECELFQGVGMADHAWKIAKALHDQKIPRQLGLSIEGKKREVENGVIKKADVYGYAITPYPANDSARASVLIKSITGQANVKQDVFLYDPNMSTSSMVDKSVSALVEAVSQGLQKAVATGYTSDSVSQVGGASVRKESVDSKVFGFKDSCSLLRSIHKKELPPAVMAMCERIINKGASQDNEISDVEMAVMVSVLTGQPLLKSIEALYE